MITIARDIIIQQKSKYNKFQENQYKNLQLISKSFDRNNLNS